MDASAAAISSGSLASDAWKVAAVPAKPPWIDPGMPIEAAAFATPIVASLSEWPGARLNDTVAATKGPWWLTDKGVCPGPKWLNAARGTMVSFAVLTEAPADAELLP